MIMATVKVKFCPSSVTGKAGTVYYQLTHRREKQQIASDICLLPDQWETVINGHSGRRYGFAAKTHK